MRAHDLSQEDRDFVTAFEACRIGPAEFDHRAHLRLAYCYLAEDSAESALAKFRESLLRFLRHHRVDPGKYSETLTQAWLRTVHDFMQVQRGTRTAEEFLVRAPGLLDRRIVREHCEKEVSS